VPLAQKRIQALKKNIKSNREIFLAKELERNDLNKEVQLLLAFLLYIKVRSRNQTNN